MVGRGAVVPHSSPQIVPGLLGLAIGPHSYRIFFMFMGWSMSAGRGERKKIKYVKVCRGTLCPCSLCVCDRAAALTLYPPSDPTLPRLALHPHGVPFSVHDMLLSCPDLLYSQFNFSFTEDVCQRLHLSKQRP